MEIQKSGWHVARPAITRGSVLGMGGGNHKSQQMLTMTMMMMRGEVGEDHYLSTMTKMDDTEPTSAPPARCPFSGVAIDPELWKTFQAKLRAQQGEDSNDEVLGDLRKLHSGVDKNILNNHNMHPAPVIYTKEANNSILVLDTTNSSLLRVNISNDLTKRSKDLLLDISENETLWDAIYNDPSVKAANIRKWNSEIAACVKAGTKVIQLVVVSTTTTTTTTNTTPKIVKELCDRTYSLQALKETTTRQLYEQVMVPDSSMSDLAVYLKLVCVEDTANA
jgi:hypothetical protein